MSKTIVAVPKTRSFYEIDEDFADSNNVTSKQTVAYPTPINNGSNDQMVTGGISEDS